MFHFPARVFNERIAVFVDSFYEEMARLFASQGWGWEAPRRSAGSRRPELVEGRRADASWQHPDFVVRIAGRHKDSAIRVLEWKALRLPGVEDIGAAGNPVVRNEHRFRIAIPRAYPSDLGSIEIRAMTKLFHPRLWPEGTGPACIFVNGEIDRVLWSIVRHVLLDPEHVQPPKLFRGQDRGMNLMAMNWYEANPHGIHKRLLDLWAEAHGAKEFKAAEKKGGGVKIEG